MMLLQGMIPEMTFIVPHWRDLSCKSSDSSGEEDDKLYSWYLAV